MVIPQSVFEAVRADVEAFGLSRACAALVASAFALARELDSVENSATSKAACARSLRETLDRLRELAPAAADADRLDELGSRRSRRRESVAS